MKQVKPIRIEEEMINQIQAVADSDFNGNFTAAAIDLMLCGISMRKIPENVRDEMRAGLVRLNGNGAEFYHDNPRIVIDALQV